MMERLLKMKEVSEITGSSLSGCYAAVDAKIWPSVRIGRSVRVPLTGLQEWIKQNTEGGQAA